MKNFFNYIRYSGLWVGVTVNPFHWRIDVIRGGREWPEAYIFEVTIYLGAIYLRIVIDDGSW